MNDAEKAFLQSITNKIKKFSIPITVKEVIAHNSGNFVETLYSNNKTELVDAGIENFLCSISPYYFMASYAFIDFPGIGIIPFNLYYFQIEILKEVEFFKKIIFLKTRQCGISTIFALYCFWKCNFHESEYIDIVSTKLNKAQDFMSKITPTLERLPSFLKVPLVNKSLKRLKWANHSQMLSEPASDKAGRSDALSLLVLDEAAHYLSDRLTRGIVGAALPTLARTGGSLIVISTPNGLAGSGAYYAEQVNQLRVAEEKNEKLIEIDWWEVPDIEGIEPAKGYNKVLEKYIRRNYYNRPLLRKEAKDFFSSIAEKWKENGWLKKQHDDLNDILYKQEVLHSFIVFGNQIFSDDIFVRVKDSIKEPIEKDKLGNMGFKGFWIWEKPTPKKRYIIGVDVGTGTGQDSSSLEIIEVEKYEQVAEFKGFISTPAFGRAIKKVAKYYNEAYVVIEANGIGEAIFNEVYYHDEDPYNNVYKKKKTKNNVTRMTGWETTSKSRPLVTNNLIDWLTVDELWDELKIYSSRIYDEIITWIWKGKKADHAEGASDDILMALAIALYNREKAISSSESFIIDEKGNLLEYKEEDGEKEEEKEDDFDVLFMDSETKDEFKEKYNVSRDQYKWLISSNKQ